MADYLPEETTVAEFCSRVSEVIGQSNWQAITQEMTDTFANLTRDFQFIHVDPKRAAASPFGGTIAHGFLTLSLIATMSFDVLPIFHDQIVSLNYGFDRVRFVSPVPVGARFRATFKLTQATPRSNGEVTLRFEVTVELEAQEKPCLVAEWLMLVRTNCAAAA